MRSVVAMVIFICVSSLFIACGGSNSKPVIEREVVVILGDVHFAKNSAELAPEAKKEVMNYKGRLQGVDNPILVEGFTDNSGTVAFNLDLSQKRAQAVAKLIVDVLGVDSSRVTAKGFGVENPAFPNTTEENRIKNRRVEVVLMPHAQK
ncbi:MAG: OmpA family protein [Spirochaetota bacterium]|jgi:outer membrane protein OmpA-like peptidoglycan-associated protein|nr:OmpA family protein [Spirochaetota bacterium]